ncbi:MAG TPA: SIMPL domain-containing protein [Bacillota bacterium]|nr:SIMPL domain-containing protein [Bacillota bacterium]
MTNQISFRIMTLTGQGRITLIPDIAIIRLGVELTGDDLAQLQSQNAMLSQSVLDTLRRMGVSDIRTYQYTIDRNYEYVDGTPVDQGFTVRNILEIRTGDMESVGTVIDAAVGAGANTVDLISLETSDPEYYYQQALNLAVANAIEKARSISGNLGIRIDPIPASITENSAMPRPALPFQRELAATPIVPGEIAVEANITAEFTY